MLQVANSRDGPRERPWPVCVLPKNDKLHYFDSMDRKLVETSDDQLPVQGHKDIGGRLLLRDFSLLETGDELLPGQGYMGLRYPIPPFAYIVCEKYAEELKSPTDRRIKNANLKFLVEYVYLRKGYTKTIRAEGDCDVLGHFAELCKLMCRNCRR